MKCAIRLIQLLAIGWLCLSCSSSTDSNDDTIPDPEPDPQTLQPEWEILQRSPESNGNAEAWGLDILDGQIYWAVSQVMPGSQMDVFLHQIDPDGSTNWMEEAASNPFTDQAYFLTVTDSIAYIGGRTCRTAVGIGQCDALIIKVDASNGTPIQESSWDRGFGYEEVDGINPQTTGLIVSGWSAGDGTGMDLFLQRIDHSLNELWTNTWSSPGNREDHQDGHIVTDDSFVYMAGLYDGSPGLGWNGKSLLLKADKNTGALIDSVTFGRSDTWINAENALGMSTDGEFLYLTGFTTPAANNWDIFIAKYDKNMNQLWHTSWGGENTESARSLVIDSAGQIFVAGTTQSFGEGGSEVVLLKLNSSGDVDWYRHWGGSGDDSAFDIQLDNGSVYITGRTNSFHPNGRNEAFLIKEDVD